MIQRETQVAETQEFVIKNLPEFQRILKNAFPTVQLWIMDNESPERFDWDDRCHIMLYVEKGGWPTESQDAGLDGDLLDMVSDYLDEGEVAVFNYHSSNEGRGFYFKSMAVDEYGNKTTVGQDQIQKLHEFIREMRSSR